MSDFQAKMHQIRFWLGLRLQRSPDLLAGFRVPLRGRKGEREGMGKGRGEGCGGRGWGGEEGRERKGRDGGGKGEGDRGNGRDGTGHEMGREGKEWRGGKGRRGQYSSPTFNSWCRYCVWSVQLNSPTLPRPNRTKAGAWLPVLSVALQRFQFNSWRLTSFFHASVLSSFY